MARGSERFAAKIQPYVLSYVITSSSGKQYDVAGQEQMIATNTGSRVEFVIGGLSSRESYRFSVAAVGPTGNGPDARTGWETVAP